MPLHCATAAHNGTNVTAGDSAVSAKQFAAKATACN